MFCWEILGPGICVEANLHVPATQTLYTTSQQ